MQISTSGRKTFITTLSLIGTIFAWLPQNKWFSSPHSLIMTYTNLNLMCLLTIFNQSYHMLSTNIWAFCFKLTFPPHFASPFYGHPKNHHQQQKYILSITVLWTIMTDQYFLNCRLCENNTSLIFIILKHFEVTGRKWILCTLGVITPVGHIILIHIQTNNVNW